jgi:hypothetical protein
VTDGRVWVHDPDGDLAVRRAVKTGVERPGPDGIPLVEVLEGLDWTVELIDMGRELLPTDGAPEGVPVEVIEGTAGNAQEERP